MLLAEDVQKRSRSILYLLSTEKFCEFFKTATPKQKALVSHYVSLADHDSLRAMLKSFQYADLEKLNVRELRKLASKKGITDYHLLWKDELIAELRNVNCESPGITFHDAAPRRSSGDQGGDMESTPGENRSERSLSRGLGLYSWTIDVHA